VNYERFSHLWDTIVGPGSGPVTGMQPATRSALVAYANGDKGQIEAVREFLQPRGYSSPGLPGDEPLVSFPGKPGGLTSSDWASVKTSPTGPRASW
jgi:hypothetical protein